MGYFRQVPAAPLAMAATKTNPSHQTALRGLPGIGCGECIGTSVDSALGEGKGGPAPVLGIGPVSPSPIVGLGPTAGQLVDQATRRGA